jgi:quercetin dioxygenase-like cupin family protein
VSTATTGVPGLLLLRQADLLSAAPTEHVLQQSIWLMHETELSRSSLVRVDGETPMVAHDGRRMLVVLDGSLRLESLDRQELAPTGAYVDIPSGVAYRMVPVDGTTPLAVSFEVPKVALHEANSGPFRPESRAASELVRTQESIMASPPSWDDPSDRGWTLAKTPELRVNLVDMVTDLKNHLHPDADHSLILLSGGARVVTPNEEQNLTVGSYVSIPAGVPHKYLIDNGQPALFVSFDAPAYDSAKTVYLE